MTRNIGIKVPDPGKEIEENEKKNPFNGTLSVRGKLFQGKVIKSKAKNTVVIEKEKPIYFSKFKRYGRSKSKIHAHVPTNIDVQEGNHVIAAECRQLSKSVSYVVIQVKK